MPFTLIIIAVVLGVAYFILSYEKKAVKPNSLLQFIAHGKDAGFSFRDIELLRRLALAAKIEEPTSVFLSQRQLDLCIKALVLNTKVQGKESDPEYQDFLSKLYEYRKRIEMEKPRLRNGIQSSHFIEDDQQLRILLEDTGVFKSAVIKNTSPYITVTRPSSPKLPAGFSWQGRKVSIFFWRNDDAGYVFDSEVLDEVFSKGSSALKIAHSNKLVRTQKRKSIRSKLHKAAFFYMLYSDEDIGGIESEPGLKCFLEDLSDCGCAVTIGGKAAVDMRVKIQFLLDNQVIAMCGTVRSIDFKDDVNRSVLHIEADPLPLDIRNHILAQVFGTLPDEVEDLPYRVEEASTDDPVPPDITVGETRAAS
ncbi:pilus assembly protein PilZ [Spirochaetia bacterium]|nr:pilus assembly protein PilZ [Spirochaetia bacterium]